MYHHVFGLKSQENPMVSLRQGPNPRRLNCKSSLPKLSRNPKRATHRNTSGWKGLIQKISLYGASCEHDC